VNHLLLWLGLASTLGLAIGAAAYLFSTQGLVWALFVAPPTILIIGLLVQAGGILSREEPLS
jgi:hypothetical protein